jgi:hypothetical protein
VKELTEVHDLEYNTVNFGDIFEGKNGRIKNNYHIIILGLFMI